LIQTTTAYFNTSVQAVHHVSHRGDRREEAFRDEQDHPLMGALRGASLGAHKPGQSIYHTGVTV
jgi:hypothetical protein